MDWPHSVKELRKLIFGILPDVMIDSVISGFSYELKSQRPLLGSRLWD